MDPNDMLKIGITLFSSLAGIVGLFIAYKKYENEAYSWKQADLVISDVIALKSQLYCLNETIKFLINRWQLEKQDPNMERRFESLEAVYKNQAKRTSDFISSMEKNGNLLFLFSPQDELFVRILSLRSWLEADTNLEHPLHSRNDEIVEEVDYWATDA